jgi:hypothetical protein
MHERSRAHIHRLQSSPAGRHRPMRKRMPMGVCAGRCRGNPDPSGGEVRGGGHTLIRLGLHCKVKVRSPRGRRARCSPSAVPPCAKAESLRARSSRAGCCAKCCRAWHAVDRAPRAAWSRHVRATVHRIGDMGSQAGASDEREKQRAGVPAALYHRTAHAALPPCRAVPCRALPCLAVPCLAVPCLAQSSHGTSSSPQFARPALRPPPPFPPLPPGPPARAHAQTHGCPAATQRTRPARPVGLDEPMRKLRRLLRPFFGGVPRANAAGIADLMCAVLLKGALGSGRSGPVPYCVPRKALSTLCTACMSMHGTTAPMAARSALTRPHPKMPTDANRIAFAAQTCNAPEGVAAACAVHVHGSFWAEVSRKFLVEAACMQAPRSVRQQSWRQSRLSVASTGSSSAAQSWLLWLAARSLPPTRACARVHTRHATCSCMCAGAVPKSHWLCKAPNVYADGADFPRRVG